MIGLICAVVPAVALGVAFGSTSIGLDTVLNVLFDPIFGTGTEVSPADYSIIANLRVPQVLAAFFVGGGLSVIGVAMQALVRNPLAEPYILGISSGASAGASLFYLGFLPPVVAAWLSLPLAAFLGALLAISAVYLVARSDGMVSVSRLLLAGVAMASLMAALTAFVTYASPDPNKLRTVLFWLMGSLSRYTWDLLLLPAIASTIGLVSLFVLSRRLDALLLGEEPAATLGVRVESIKRFLVVLAAFVTGIIVAYSGAIGFIGLIVPHAVRSVVGVNHRYVVPVSFVGGGIFLIGADLLARTLLPGQVLPVGILTAVAGVPFFLILLRRSQYNFA